MNNSISEADLAKAKDYRQRAARIREAAEYAERSEFSRGELQHAAWLSYQADVLEGKVKPPAPRPEQKTPEQRQAEYRANYNRAFSELSAFFAPKPKPDTV